jgi:hypothetical protein
MNGLFIHALNGDSTIGTFTYDGSNPSAGGSFAPQVGDRMIGFTMVNQDINVTTDNQKDFIINNVAGDFSNLPNYGDTNPSLGTWNIVSEPTTIALLGLGGAALLGRRTGKGNPPPPGR